MNRVIKDGFILLILLLPTLALGHEGHGVPGSLAHEMNHASWLMFSLVALLAAALIIGSAMGKDEEGL
jgi:hypothetical protein